MAPKRDSTRQRPRSPPREMEQAPAPGAPPPAVQDVSSMAAVDGAAVLAKSDAEALADFTVVIVTAFPFGAESRPVLKYTLTTRGKESVEHTAEVYLAEREPSARNYVWVTTVRAPEGAELKYTLIMNGTEQNANTAKHRCCVLGHPVVVVSVRDKFDGGLIFNNTTQAVEPKAAIHGTMTAVGLDSGCTSARTVEEFCFAFAKLTHPDEKMMPTLSVPGLAAVVRGAWEVDGLSPDRDLARQLCFAAAVSVKSCVQFFGLRNCMTDVHDCVCFAAELLSAVESQGSVRVFDLKEKLQKWLAKVRSEGNMIPRKKAEKVLAIWKNDERGLYDLSPDEVNSLRAFPDLLRQYLFGSTSTLRGFFEKVAQHSRMAWLDDLPWFLNKATVQIVSDEEFMTVLEEVEAHKHERTLREVVFGNALFTRKKVTPTAFDDPFLCTSVSAAYGFLNPDTAWDLCERRVCTHLDDLAKRGNSTGEVVELLWKFAELCETICTPLAERVCDTIVGKGLLPTVATGAGGVLARLRGCVKRRASSRLPLVKHEEQFLQENLPKAFPSHIALCRLLVEDGLACDPFVSQTLVHAPLKRSLAAAEVRAKRNVSDVVALSHLLDGCDVPATQAKLVLASLADAHLCTSYATLASLLAVPEILQGVGSDVWEKHRCVESQSRFLVAALEEARASQAELNTLNSRGVLTRLTRPHPKFDADSVLKHACSTTAMARRLLGAAVECAETVMRGMPVFAACVEPFAKRMQDRLSTLDTTPICDLSVDAFKHEDMLSSVTVRLNECLRCHLYEQLWDDASHSDESHSLPEDATDADVADALIAAEQKVTKVFATCVERIIDGTATHRDLRLAVAQVESAPRLETSIAHERSRDAFREHTEAACGGALADIEEQVNGVFDLYLHFARDGTGCAAHADARSRVVSDVQKVAQALWLQGDFRALLGLVDELRDSDADCAASRSCVHALCEALGKFAGGGCDLRTLLTAYEKFHTMHGHVMSTGAQPACRLRLVAGFAPLFLVLVSEGVLDQLKVEPDIEKLDAFVQRRLQELTDDHSADILNAFQVLAADLAGEGQRDWEAVVQRRVGRADIVFGFVVRCGGSMPVVEALRGNVKQLRQIRDDNADVQTIHHVLHLLTRGSLRVRLPEDGSPPECGAVVPPPQRRHDAAGAAASATQVSEAVLQEWRAQLDAVGVGVEADADAYSDDDNDSDEWIPVDADAPAQTLRLRTPQDRRKLVQLFTRTIDVISDLKEVVRTYQMSGHPKSLTRFTPQLEVSFEDAHAADVLRAIRVDVIDVLKAEREEWAAVTLPRAREEHPVLAHLPRAVLARCVAAAAEGDARTLRKTVENLTGAALDDEDVQRALGSAAESLSPPPPPGADTGAVQSADTFLDACAAVAAVAGQAAALTVPATVERAATDATVAAAVDSLRRSVALVSLPDEDAEVTAAHVPILATAVAGQLTGRMPHPHEVLLCEEATPIEDVDDMLHRWSQSRSEESCCFIIANVERLERRIASHLAARLRREAVAAAAAPLLAWVSGACPQVRDLKPFQTELDAKLCEALLDLARPVFAPLFGSTFASLKPHAGKTRCVMREVREHELYASIPVSGQTTVFAFVELLAATVREAQAAGQATCLHIDLSPDVDVVFATTMLFDLVVFRRVVGRSGVAVRLPDTMRVAVEIASDPFRSVVPLVELFARNVHGLLSTDRVAVELRSGATRLYRLSFVPDAVLNDGARLLVAYAEALRAGNCTMRSGGAILQDPLPAEKALTESARFLLGLAGDAPLPTNFFAFFRFAAVQSSHIVGTAGNESVFMCDDRNLNRLLFYYLKLAVQCAKWMAAEGLRPKRRRDEDDVERFADMESFERWSCEPLLVAEPDNYTVFSLDDHCHVLQNLTAGDQDAEFRQFMQTQTLLKGEGRSSLQGCCTQVSDSEKIFRDYETNPLRDVLNLISPHGKLATRLFAKLKRVDDLASRAAEKEREAVYAPDAAAEVGLLEDEGVDAACDGYALLEELGVEVPAAEDQRRDGTAFKTDAERWLKLIFGTRDAIDRPPFVLLVDLLVKIVSMKLRVVCGLPVLWVGESGSGKTIAVEVFARASTGHAPYVVNVNGGVTPQRLLELLRPAIDAARAHPERRVVVQLDEVNTMQDMWTAKQALCDRFVLGERIPDNVLFVAIMNPIRRRNAEQQATHDAIDSLGGLNYSATVARAASSAQDEGEPVASSAPSYVYQVNPTPDSMMAYAWDFGSAAQRMSTREEAMQVVGDRTPLHFAAQAEVSDEVLFAEVTLDWVVRVKLSVDEPLCKAFLRAQDREGKQSHWRAFRSIVCAMLSTSQRFVRGVFRGDRSVVSLRDMVRTVKFIPFVLRMIETRAAVRGDREGRSPFADLTQAVQVAFILVYHLRLDVAGKSRYLSELRAAWGNERRHFDDISNDFMAVPAGSPQELYAAFDDLAEYCCGCLPVDDGLAVNEALKENVLSMFAAFMTQQAHFIVGRAGSSKTRSVESLIQATDPGVTSERCRFFREFGVRFQKFVLQCSRNTAPGDVLRVAQAAAKYQASRQEEVRCILVLEEVGVTIGSKHNPLMMLHALIDFGIPAGGAAGAGLVRLPILGVSNWMLDGSKMNRGTIVHRGNPSVADLLLTAKNLSPEELPDLAHFAEVFHRYILSTGTSEQLRTYRWFYGMRDFYSFVKTLVDLRSRRPPQRAAGAVNTAAFEGEWEREFVLVESGANRRAARDGRQVHRHLVAWALRIAFGGLPSQCEEAERELFVRLLGSFNVPESRAHYECDSDTTPAAIASAIAARERGAGEAAAAVHRQPTCSVCALLRFETALSCSERLQEARDGSGQRTTPLAERCHLFGRFAASYEKQVSCGTFDGSLDALLPLDAEVVAYALSNPQARHLLLFTRDNSALRLLFDMGFVAPQRSTVIFGSPSGGFVSQTTRSADLAKVKACLRCGGVLVLVNASHLYETILDALNLNYSREGTTFRTRLPTATGYSESVRIDPRFRCVVLCEEAFATSLLPPFINRFMKARLSFARMLTVPQRNKSRDLEERTNLVVAAEPAAIGGPEGRVPAAAAGATVNLLSLVVPGFSNETLPSAVILADASLHQRAAAAASAGAAEDADGEGKFAVEGRLAWCASPWALERVYNGLASLPGLDTERNRAVVALVQNRMLNFDGAPRTHMLRRDAYDAWSLNPDAQHFFVSTEQMVVDFAVVAREVECVLAHTNGWDEPPIDCEVIRPSPDHWALDLGAEGSDVIVRRMLRELSEAPGAEGTACAVAILYFDATVASPAVDGIMFDISQRQLDAGRHVVVVALAQTQLDAAGRLDASYKLTLVPDWVQLHVDEVVPSYQLDVSLHELRTRHAAGGDPCEFARWGEQLLRESAPRLAQDVASVHDSVAGAAHSGPLHAGDVVALLDLPHFATMCDAAAHLLLRDIDALRNGRWVRLALQCASEAGSLRQSLCLFLASVWSRCLACLFAPVLSAGFVSDAVAAATCDGHNHHHAVFRLAVLPGLLGATSADALGDASVKIPDAVLDVSAPLRQAASLPLLTSVWQAQRLQRGGFPLLGWVASQVSREASRLREGEALSARALRPNLLQAVDRQPREYLDGVLRRLVEVHTSQAAGFDDIVRAVLNLAVATSGTVCLHAGSVHGDGEGHGDEHGDLRLSFFVHEYHARRPDMFASVCAAVEHVAAVGCEDKMRRLAAASQAEAAKWTQRQVADTLLTHAVTVGAMPSLRRVVESCSSDGCGAHVDPTLDGTGDDLEADEGEDAGMQCVFLWPVEEAVAAVADGDKPFAAAVAAEGRCGVVEALRVVLDATQHATDEARLILVSELLSPSDGRAWRDAPCAFKARDMFADTLAGLHGRECSELWRATLARYFVVHWLAAESLGADRDDADNVPALWDAEEVVGGCGGPVELVRTVVSLVSGSVPVRGVPPLETLASEAWMGNLRDLSAGHTQSHVAEPVMFGVLAAAVSRLGCSLRHVRSGAPPPAAPLANLPLLRRCLDSALRECNGRPLHEMLLVAFLRALSVGGADSDRARVILRAELQHPDASSLLPDSLCEAGIAKRFLNPAKLSGPLDSFPQFTPAYSCFERSQDSGVLENAWQEFSPAARAAVLVLCPADRRGEDVWQRAAATLAPDHHFGRWVRDAAQASDPVGFEAADVDDVKQLVVHAQIMMLAADGSTCGVVGFFGDMARNTYNPGGEYPCVADSLEADSILNAPGGTYVYTCPNGHHYTTDACENIQQQRGACAFVDALTGQRCGAVIGGSAYGVPLPGNHRVGSVDDLRNRAHVFHKTTGYANTAPMSDAHLPRGMQAHVFYSCRVLTIIALLCSRTVAPTAHHRVDYWVDLRGAIGDLRNCLFREAELKAAVTWLHALLAVSFDPDAGNTAAITGGRSALEQEFSRLAGPPTTAGDLLRRFEELRAQGLAASDALRDQIALTDAYVEEATKAEGTPEWQLRAFEYCGGEDTPANAADAALDDAAARSALVAAVRRCLPCASELRARAFVALVKFVDGLTAAAERSALTPQQAQTMTMAGFVASDDHAELRGCWEALQEVGPNHLVRHVRRYNCTNVEEQFAHVAELPDTCSVAHFLPAAENEGLFAKALYGGLGEDNRPAALAPAQNELVRETRRHLGLGEPREAVAVPAEVSPHDLLCVAGSVPEMLRRVIAPFTSNLRRARVADELLPAVEKRIIVAARLALAPALPVELPDYGGRCHPLVEFCRALEAAGQSVALPPPAVAAFFADVAGVRPVRAATYSLLQLLMLEWMRAVRRNPADWTATTALDAVEVDTAMLTPPQQQVLGRLATQRHVFRGCTLAMLPVVLGLLWIPDDLPDCVRQKPGVPEAGDACEQAASAIKTSPRAAHAVTLLWLLGIAHLRAGEDLSDAVLDCDVFTLCDGVYAHPLEEDADAAVIEALSNVPLRHYDALRDAVERGVDGHAVFTRHTGGTVADDAAPGASPAVAAALRRSLVTNAPAVQRGAAAPSLRNAPRAARQTAGEPGSPRAGREAHGLPKQRAPRIRWGDGRPVERETPDLAAR